MFGSHRCTGVVSTLIGDIQMDRDAAIELLDEINVIKGGLFPFDQLTKNAVTRAVRHGVSLDAADDVGKTALHYAAERGGFWGGLPLTIEALLKGGANPNAQDAGCKRENGVTLCGMSGEAAAVEPERNRAPCERKRGGPSCNR